MLLEKRDSTKAAKGRSFAQVSASYTSDYVYMGRSDSARARYFTFSSGYYHKSGIFARGSVSYLTTKGDDRVDLYTITGGYDYFGRKLFAGVSFSGYIFNANSYAVQSEMTAYLNGTVGYDFYYVTLIADASAGFSDMTDFFMGAEVTHAFYALSDKLRIVPSFYLAAGTQHYYDQYYTNRSMSTGQGKAQGKGFGHGVKPDSQSDVQIDVQGSQEFNILNYEASVEVSYKIERLRIIFTPIWTFPVNPITVVMDDLSYTEDLTNRFYWSAAVRYFIY